MPDPVCSMRQDRVRATVRHQVHPSVGGSVKTAPDPAPTVREVVLLCLAAVVGFVNLARLLRASRRAR